MISALLVIATVSDPCEGANDDDGNSFAVRVREWANMFIRDVEVD